MVEAKVQGCIGGRTSYPTNIPFVNVNQPLKIQVWGYGWVQRSRSQSESKSLSTYHSWNTFIPKVVLESQSEWMIKFNSLSRTADIDVNVIHISCVIKTYTLESVSSLT